MSSGVAKFPKRLAADLEAASRQMIPFGQVSHQPTRRGETGLRSVSCRNRDLGPLWQRLARTIRGGFVTKSSHTLQSEHRPMAPAFASLS